MHFRITGINRFAKIERRVMKIHEPYRQSELEEVLGVLHSLEITDIGLVACIGKISLLLPIELAGQLKGLKGHRVSILRLDGYHLRCLDGEKHGYKSRGATLGRDPETKARR